MRSIAALITAVLVCSGCSHFANKNVYEARLLVLDFGRCKTMSTLESLETSLFYVGFAREPAHEDAPVPFELRESHVANAPRFFTYVKTDLDAENGVTENRYRITSCEQGGGGLSLVVLRLVDGENPEEEGRFLGVRFTDVLNAAARASRCTWTAVGEPKKILFHDDDAEAQVLERAKRGLCHDIASRK